MTQDIQIIIWVTLGVLFLINGVFALFYNLHMRGSVKPDKLTYSALFPLWWLDTEVLTDIGLKYRIKYLVHLTIGAVLLFAALLLWAFGELNTNV
jgi:hypothetical protein